MYICLRLTVESTHESVGQCSVSIHLDVEVELYQSALRSFVLLVSHGTVRDLCGFTALHGVQYLRIAVLYGWNLLA